MAEKNDMKVLVTGGSGYVASWIVKKLLDKGVDVNTTVRNLESLGKFAHLRKIGNEAPGHLEIFEADLLKEGSFGPAMEGCNIVIHTASPFIIGKIKNPYKSLVNPALEGTENVLSTVNKTLSVKRVVLTSSVVAVYGDNIDISQADEGVFNEEHWNTTSTPETQPYPYSKTVAEQRAWEMAANSDRWDMVAINPGFIIGPSLTIRNDSTSINLMIQLADGTFKMGTPAVYNGVVDVRNVADAHLEAAFRPQANGRYILVNEVMSFLEIAHVLRKKYGKKLRLPKKELPKWLVMLMGPLQGIKRSYVKNNIGIPIAFDNSRSKQDLDINYISLEQTIIDHAEQLLSDNHIDIGGR